MKLRKTLTKEEEKIAKPGGKDQLYIRDRR